MATISLSMIVRNEEKFLEDCLQSVQGMVDEIVIADTGSTDSTLAIAQRYGATVLSIPWTNDFSAARNESLRHAKSDWILYLDADERLAPGQDQLIKSLVQAPDVDAYLVVIEGEHYLPGGVVKQRNTYPRLFRKYSSVKFEGSVHEQITPSLLRSGKTLAPSNLTIVHLGYRQSFEIIKEKCQRNIALLREQLKRNPKDFYAQFQIGNTLSVLGDYESARKELEPILKYSQVASSLRASVLNILAEIDIRENDFNKAISRSLQSLKLAPSQILARWFLAVAYINKGNYPGAVNLLEQILETQQASQNRGERETAHDVSVEEPKVLLQLGTCYERLRKHDEAFSCYVQALGQAPSMKVCIDGLNRVVNSLEDYKHAIQQAEANNVFSYSLYKQAVEKAIQKGQFSDALGYIEKIVRSNSIEVPDHTRQRLQELQTMLSSQHQTQQ